MKQVLRRPADDANIPRAALLLGLAGVVPFVLLLLGMMIGAEKQLGLPAGEFRDILKIYGAIIVSFLGGIRWGIGMHRENLHEAASLFGMAVLPPLLAWAAILMSHPFDLLVLIVTMLVVGGADIALARRGTAPAWYGRLRGLLTLAVVACLVAALALWPFMPV